MANPNDLEHYFRQRADLAEKLFRDGWREEAYLVATIALDALAAIWAHDSARGVVNAGGAPSPTAALRFNQLLDAFAPGDEHAPKVAVVLFAEDLGRMRPDLAETAARLLKRRVELDELPAPMRFRASPLVHLDCSVQALAEEAPELDSKALEVAEHYRYPAFTYRFLRSSTAHAALRGERVNRFSGNEPERTVDYFPEWTDGVNTRPISLGIGLGVITEWVRQVVSEYVRHCSTPAEGFEPSREAQDRLDKLWMRSGS